jgi:terminase, large subunit
VIEVADIIRDSMLAWRPPPRLNLDEWADQHFYLSAESAAEPGRWRTLPYQRGVMQAITDPTIERISLMKSARVGYTKIIGAAIGYHMHQSPCSIMVVQPTVDDAKDYSKEEIAPMLRDCPALSNLVRDSGPRDSDDTILHKQFPGGVLSMVGANSARGFRRSSRKIVIFDEVDGYPPSAGSEGDQIQLGIMRTQTFWDRKIIAGSTPTLAGASRIESMFEEGDQRRYYVPCPHCGRMDFLAFRETFEIDGEPAGHFMDWPDGRPEEAHFVCRGCACVIEHKHKRDMIERGEWRARREFKGHASFHIWAAYSYSPNATWADIACEFVAASADEGSVEKLKTFVNTVLGMTFQERGDAPEWVRLYHRRELYPIGTVPGPVKFLTMGVDVQKDRLVYEVVGWRVEDKQSWSIDAGVIVGDTSEENSAAWRGLVELIERQWPTAGGGALPISGLAVDSGWNTNTVYNWTRRFPTNRVMATKGVDGPRPMVGTPTPVDVTSNGKRIQRGARVWPIGVSTAKSELYGWLNLEPPAEGAEAPIGFCHFPQHPEEYFKQLTAEQLVLTRSRGVTALAWHVIPGRQNHWLDARILARVAASMLGLDRVRRSTPSPSEPPSNPTPEPPKPSSPAPSQHSPGRANDWLGGRGNNFMKRRR